MLEPAPDVWAAAFDNLLSVSDLKIADLSGAQQHPSEQPRWNSPISQCHRRVRVLVDLTPDELSDLAGSIGA